MIAIINRARITPFQFLLWFIVTFLTVYVAVELSRNRRVKPVAEQTATSPQIKVLAASPGNVIKSESLDQDNDGIPDAAELSTLPIETVFVAGSPASPRCSSPPQRTVEPGTT